MEFFDAVRNGIGFLRDKYARSLDPKSVITAVQKEAKRNSKAWGDDARPEAPNVFTVRVGSEDWRKYYGSRKESMEARVAKKVYLSLGELGLSMEGYPSVELLEDPSLAFGAVSVDAVFGDKVDVPDDIFKGDGQESRIGTFPRPAQAAAASIPTQPMRRKGTADAGEGLPKTEAYGRRQASSEKKKALLVFGEREYEVLPGHVIGVFRRNEDRRPDIVLDWGEFPNASQDHGVFSYDEEETCWVYENHGSWGTSVSGHEKPGSSYELGEGDTVFLDDGDEMRIAEGGTLVFRCP